MTNILITGPRTDGISGGQATHMRNLQDLSRTMNASNILFYYTSKGLDGNDSAFNKIVYFLKSLIWYPYHCARINCVHINTSFDKKALVRDLFFIIVSRLMNKKLVVQYHGGNPEALPKILQSLVRFSMFFCRTSDSILCLTDQQRSFLKRNLKTNVIQVKNYVKLPDIKKLECSNQCINFLYMGRMIKEKGIFEIIESVKDLKEQGLNNFKVEFCGTGHDLEFFLETVKKNGLEKYICYLGAVYGDKKIEIFNRSDSFLYPTTYPEGLPYSILEAMSFGLPVVSTDVGAITSVVVQNKTGIVISESNPYELTKAMKSLILNSSLRNDMGENARVLIENEYSIDAMRTIFQKFWGVN